MKPGRGREGRVVGGTQSVKHRTRARLLGSFSRSVFARHNRETRLRRQSNSPRNSSPAPKNRAGKQQYRPDSRLRNRTEKGGSVRVAELRVMLLNHSQRWK